MVCNNHDKLAGNSGKKYISLCSGMISGPASGYTHVGFKMVDLPLHNRPDFIEGGPFIRIPLDSWKHAEVHVIVGIGGSALLSGAAGLFTAADPLPFYHADFGTAPFITVSTPFFMTVPEVLHI